MLASRTIAVALIGIAVAVAAGAGLAAPERPVDGDRVQLAQADPDERTFWESVRDSTDPAEIEAYLELYPVGHFAKLAHIRLKRLRGKAKSQSETGESDAVEPPTHECDRLAAHAYDPGRVGDGVAWDDLVPEPAITACQAAVGEHPGTARFQYQLGRAFQKGERTDAAVTWYRKAATQGYAGAQFSLGLQYKYGKVVPKDDREAVTWYRSAADQGHAIAQNELGVMYAQGRGVTKDSQEAVKWYRKAAEQGYASAQTNLGEMYEDGRDVPQDDREAVKWYRKAAEQGHASAQNELGEMYVEGRGVARDYGEAVRLFRKAAEQEDNRGIFYLGGMYADGLGVAQDYGEAARLIRMSAEQGYAPAQIILGEMYDEGRGVPQDDREAVKWYRKAAAQGLFPAQNELGLMYENGRGVPKDRGEAVRRYRLAAAQGDADAIKNLKRLGEPLVDIAEIQRALADLGYDPGPSDGVAGARTRDAIRRYQRDNGLAVDGEPNATLLARLEKILADRRTGDTSGEQPKAKPKPVKLGDDLDDLKGLDKLD